jgi:hypothetical protein
MSDVLLLIGFVLFYILVPLGVLIGALIRITSSGRNRPTTPG